MKICSPVLALTLISNAFACSQPGTKVDHSRATIPRSEVHRLTPQGGDQAYQLTVVLPRSYARDSALRFPVVFMADGNVMAMVGAGVAYELGFDGNPEVILVGIDYPVPDVDGSASLRFRDLTPTTDTAAIRWLQPFFIKDGYPPPSTSGGGPEFLRFIANEVIPFVEARYRTLPADRTLLGVSLGGLFTLYAMTERPELFHRYVAISPSLWWSRRAMLPRLEAFPGRPGKDSLRVFISIGLGEGSDSLTTMIGNVQALEQAWKSRTPSGVAWYVHYFPDETHASSWPGAMSRGLRFVFGSWPLPAEKK